AAAPAAGAPHFTDVLGESGIDFRHHFIDSESGSRYRINPYDHGSGVLVADVNGDGRDDIYLLDFLGPNQLYLNRGGMKFDKATPAAGIGLDRAVHVGGAFGDYDNDGDPDLYATTYRGGNHLFRNRGDGTFEDVTEVAGVGYVGHSSSATWFDYDGDGDLDLYLSNIGRFTTDTISQEADYVYEGVALPFETVARKPDNRNPGEPNRLWRNEGGGRFHDVTEEAGVGAAEWNPDAAVADIDLDGDLDLYVSNMFGANHLYRNRGNGSFEEITDAALERTSWGGMGCVFFDADGDEWPDLYVVDMHSDMWTKTNTPGVVQAAAKFDTPLGTAVPLGKVIRTPDETRARSVLFGNTFFTRRADGGFVERSQAAGLETWWPWGIAVGDYDNDGWQDAFIPAGMGYPYYYWPNSLMMNRGGGVFVDTAAASLGTPAGGETIPGAAIRETPFVRSSRAAAVADFDQDGDLDLIVNNFNAPPYLLRNDSPAAHWIGVELRGQRSNREGYGARVRVTAGGHVWTRQLANAEGYLSQSSRVLHFGLAGATAVERVDVFWPGTAPPQQLLAPPIDRVVQVVQP
ncbi:MAG TPA: CRTAC1 family protein, partial [Candidatus Polarisedimenticolaceae bacterium]|nr:CRTAC1 family protein [Candidatus Polarisedimenticolaceae bacterium]